MTLAFDALDAPDSPLARLDPRWKLAALVLAGVAASALRSPALVLAAGLGALALLLIARLPRRLVASRLGAFGLFLLPFLFVLPALRGWTGLQSAAVVGTRAATLFVLALILIATAPLHRTLQAAQWLGMPRLLTQIVLMSYRYLFVLRDEFQRVRTALRVRGFRTGTNRHTYRTVGHVVGALLVRGDERADRVGRAMRCRGFDGRFRSLHAFRTRPADLLFFTLVAGIALGLLGSDWLLRI